MSNTDFCGLWWYSYGYTHSCLKREGHDGPHWCCNDDPDKGDGGYPGGTSWTGPVWKTAAAAKDAAEEGTTA